MGIRSIEFRGKRKDNGEWVYGDFLQDKDLEQYMIEYFVYYTDADGLQRDYIQCEVTEDTIGQYTGLTDKNGTKIFEGDILQFDYIGENLGVEGIANVVFNNGKFGVLWGYHKEFVCIDGFANTEITVIGNIHDNPELL